MKNNHNGIESGSDSTNVQGRDHLTVNQYGVTATEVRILALDVFKSNFFDLSRDAHEIALKRAEILTDKLIERLKVEQQNLLDEMNKPDMQYVLFEAQKTYARTGDEDMSEVLVNLLIERAKEKERTTLQIVLNESISLVHKLTFEQLDILSLVFILKYVNCWPLANKEGVTDFYYKKIHPFINNEINKTVNFQHIEFTGCGSVSIGSVNLSDVFHNKYPGIFSTGLKEEDILEITKDPHVHQLFTRHIFEPEKFQFVTSQEAQITLFFLSLDQDIKNKLLSLFRSSILPKERVSNYLTPLIPEWSNLFYLWNSTKLENMSLTSVGIALAVSNLKRRGVTDYDVRLWIK